MATSSPPKNPEDSIHGEEEKKPLFPANESPGRVYDDQASPEALGQIPTASQEGIDHLRKQHRGGELSGSDLKGREEGAASGPGASIGAEEKGLMGKAGQIGKGFNPTDTALPPQAKAVAAIASLFTTNRRKKTAAGGIAVGLVTVVILGASISQGPLQLIHLSQILQKNLLKGENDTNSRLARMFRYYRTNDPGSTRVGLGGQRVFDKSVKQMKNKGFEFKRTATVGNPRVLEIDTSKDNPYKGMSKDQARKAIAADLGIPESRVGQTSGLGDGLKFSVNISDLNAKKLRAVRGVVINMLDNGKMYSALQKRNIDKFFNIDRVSLTNNLENRAANKAVLREREKSRQQKKRSATRERITKLRADLSERSKNSKGFKGAMVALTGVEGICLVHTVSGVVPMLNAATRADSIVAAEDLITLGDQLREGEGFQANQPGAVADEFKDDSEKSIWQGKALQATANYPNLSGDDLDKNIRQAFTGESSWNDIHAFTGNLPGVDAACSTAGQAVIGVVGITAIVFTGPGGGAVIQATKFVAGSAAGVVVMNLVTNLISPDASKIPEIIAGPLGGNYIAYGAREAANVSARAAGGVELSKDESLAIDKRIEQESRREFSQKDIATRLFDIYDYRSLASASLNHLNLQPSSIFSSLGQSLSKITQPATSLAFLNPLASAASSEDYDWGFNRYGLRQSVLDDEQYADPVENAEKAMSYIKGDGQLVDRIKSCFGAKLNDEGSGFVKENEVDQYGEDYQSSNCNEDSEKWNRISLAIFDDSLIVSALCYELDDEEACGEIGLGPKNGGTSSLPPASGQAGPKIDLSALKEPSDNIDCAVDTKDLGVHEAYTEGKMVKIRLCAIPNIKSSGQESHNQYGVTGAEGSAVVNARVSGAWYSLAKAAARDGVDVSANSSFRSMAHQQQLCSENTACSSGDYSFVAKPGTSNHQLGVAIDFSHGGKGGSADNCDGGRGSDPCILKGNETWEWLNDNASRFKIKQYSKEFWHWSPLENGT